MAVTINVNNLSLSHKGDGGITTATIPDVCKTPTPGGPVPIPYPNIAFSRDLTKGTTTVKADGGNMCSKHGSEFFKSTGDEAGTVGGVVSSTFIKEASWMTYSLDVKFEGKGACRLTDKMFHNHQNTVNMSGKVHDPVVIEATEIPHICEKKTGKWISGPKFEFEQFEILDFSQDMIGPRGQELPYSCFDIKLKGKFVGSVECKCEECGATKTISWNSGTVEKELTVCKRLNVAQFTFDWLLKGGKVISAIKNIRKLRGLIKLDKMIQEYGHLVKPGIALVTKALEKSPHLVCVGELTKEKVQALFDSAFRPPMPPGTI